MKDMKEHKELGTFFALTDIITTCLQNTLKLMRKAGAKKSSCHWRRTDLGNI